MKPEGVLLPKLDPKWNKPKSRPVRRPGHVPSGEFFLVEGDAIKEMPGILHGARLMRSPCANLAEPRTSRPIGIRFLGAHGLYASLNKDLFFDPRPIEAETGPGIAAKRLALAALKIRIKHEAPFVCLLKEDHADGRGSLRARRGQSHGRWIGYAPLAGPGKGPAESLNCFLVWVHGYLASRPFKTGIRFPSDIRVTIW